MSKDVYDIIELVLLTVLVLCNGYIVAATGRYKKTYEDYKNKLNKK